MAVSSKSRRYTPTEASAYLWDTYRIRRSVARLKQLRAKASKGGPVYQRDGAIYVIYTEEALDTWAECQLGAEMRSTTEESALRALEATNQEQTAT